MKRIMLQWRKRKGRNKKITGGNKMKTVMKKVSAILLTPIMVTTMLMAGTVQTVQAKEQVVDEQWGKPIFVYGGSLNEKEKKKTRKFLGLAKDSDVAEVRVTGADALRFLKDANPKASMYSSALIQHNDKTGVVVQIVTPDNITRVTTTQYANALITAGATNVNVQVASPKPVTGESALTGVYKAYSEKGQGLDKARMEVAQEEISTVTGIVEANKQEQKFNEESLNKAVIEIKEGLAKEALKEDGVGEDVARLIVNQAVQRNGLSPFITQEQQDKLIDYALTYARTGAVNDKTVSENLGLLTNEVKDNVLAKSKEIGSKLNETLQDESFWSNVKQFFSDVFQTIKGWFN